MTKPIDALWHEWHLCSERAVVAAEIVTTLELRGCDRKAIKTASAIREQLRELEGKAHDAYLAALAKPLQAVRK